MIPNFACEHPHPMPTTVVTEKFRVALDDLDRTNADSVRASLDDVLAPEAVLSKLVPENGYERDYEEDGYRVVAVQPINFTIETDGIKFRAPAGDYQNLVFCVELVPVH